MTDLDFLWPILLITSMLLARIWELRRRFDVQPGTIVETATFKQLLYVGLASVLLCVGFYLWRGRPPAHLWVSIAGVALGATAFLLRASSRKALGRMWSVHVEIRDRHVLVETGPFARIRHPIYLAAILEVMAAAVVLGTWICGAVALAAIAIVVAARIRVEESAMAAKFGDAWHQYRLRTGLLWPKL
ncbi:MAG TPA: isoprenylcysteine carboxylmethyltransferase family protein [Opitutaceae bacterium]|jgi:protein-S-isoprenylcysteine O-methyltransferase Ste14